MYLINYISVIYLHTYETIEITRLGISSYKYLIHLILVY
jgi:hypothetical protein